MTAAEPPRKRARRPYRRHGLVALESALRKLGQGWLEELGPVGEALRAWREGLIEDLGGDESVSTQKRAVIDLCVREYLMLESVDRWLLAQPSLVNKRRRRLFDVVLQRQRIADSLAKHLEMLGLERGARELPSLEAYIIQRYGGEAGTAAPRDDAGEGVP